jgi:murein L,D-transpeptidase YafK
MSMSIVLRFALVATTSLMLAGCPGGGSDIVPAMKSLPAEAQVLLATKGMKQETPIFVRIFKEESELEIWKAKDDGRYYHFKTYPICAWSGTLGPKVKVGDKQAPEGFYTVTPGQMNPNSQFHLAFNLGFPNAYDKANGRTGDALMVHGDCKSAGCFAMTDALIEEIYILAREAFQGGQRQFQVHAFPFRMTEANLTRHKGSQWYGFWKTLKEGYDTFEASQLPPKVAVCEKQYLLNANFFGQEGVPNPSDSCPAYKKVQPTPFDPFNRDGPALIQAKAAQPDASGVTHVASTPQSRPAEPAVKPFAAAAMQSAGQPQQHPMALAASTPVYDRAEQPQAAAPQPQTSVPTATHEPQTAAAEPAQAAPKKPLETHGLHNVVGSGKGDMLAAPAAPAPAAPPQYTYGQANTAGSAAFR